MAFFKAADHAVNHSVYVTPSVTRVTLTGAYMASDTFYSVTSQLISADPTIFSVTQQQQSSATGFTHADVPVLLLHIK
jgi:hypothetical protein